MKSNYLRVGQIARPHGVRGDVRVNALTDDAARFRVLKDAFLEQGGTYASITVSNVRLLPDAVILHLSGTDTPEQAERLRNAFLCVDRAHAVSLPEGAYFVADLIGCQTFDTNGVSYGKLTDVLETGANDVYEIANGKLLVPALKRVLSSVDTENGRIVFDAETLAEVGCFAD